MKIFIVPLIFFAFTALLIPLTAIGSDPLGSWYFEGNPGQVTTTSPVITSRPFEDNQVQEWFVSVLTEEIPELTVYVTPAIATTFSRGPHCPGQCSISVSGTDYGSVEISFPKGYTGKLQGDILRILAPAKIEIQVQSSTGFVQVRREDTEGVWRVDLFVENPPVLDEISFQLTWSVRAFVLQRQAGGPDSYFFYPGISTSSDPDFFSKNGREQVSIWDPKKYQKAPSPFIFVDNGKEIWQAPSRSRTTTKTSSWGTIKVGQP